MLNTIKPNRVLLLIFLFVYSICYAETVLVDQHFSAVSPTGWTSTSSVWAFNRNETATGNYRSVYDATKYSARFSSAANGNSIYVYIPINFKADSLYTITFYTKRACSVEVNTNELPNQTTLLSNQSASNSNCTSNWNNWYQWSFTTQSTYTGAGYFQIWIKTVYGGPASVYMDDVTITESSPQVLPIELLYFIARSNCESDLITKWETASEHNVWKYIVMYSVDDSNYIRLDSIEDIGSSNTGNRYEMTTKMQQDGTIIYVKLREVDYDGYQKDFEPESVYIPKRCKQLAGPRVILRRYNIYGQEVDATYNGFMIILYSDNTTEYKLN